MTENTFKSLMKGGWPTTDAKVIIPLSEFEVETEAENGTQCEVIDESTHTVVKYCVAFNGYWNER